MKKYLIVGILALGILTIYNILSLYTGLYISFDNDKTINNNVYEKDKKIYIANSDKSLEIKGVELNSFYPGYNFSDYNIDTEKYLEWFEEIHEMGANTIKANNRLNPEFYEALYKYNTQKESPLYLIQCIEIEEYETNNSKSIYGFKDELIKECLSAIDVVHGNRYIVTSGIAGRGLYTKDVSKWTIAYIVSGIGKEETIAYTDNTDIRQSSYGYNGKYFYTNKDEASETEIIIAEIFDKMVQYESKKYKEQRLVSLSIDLLKSPFKYKQNVNIQLGKMAYIDMSNIKSTEDLKSGMFISYNMTGAIDEFVELLDDTELEKYKDIISTIKTDTAYGGFVEFINKYYSEPVLISSYGFSTSRIPEKQYEKPLTEEEQGNRLVQYYNDYIEAGSCGAIISNWQDNWALSNWNVNYSTNEDKEIYWFNKQSIGQCYGVLAFEAKDREKICYVDGNIEEWSDEDFIIEENGLKLYCKYDLENVYIMAKNVSKDVELYIPIDTTQNSGSSKYSNCNFKRNADFLIKVDRTDDTEILVQKYYDSIRAMYEDNITGELQYSNVPDKNTDIFSDMRTILKKKVDPEIDISLMSAEERIKYRMYSTTDTGKLVHGNGNPNSAEYNSLSDFCFGDNCVEIQIPWQMLNFSSPSEMLIHDDYYKNYGVEEIKIENIYIGIGNTESKEINFENVKLSNWKRNVNVQERRKKSYDIIKQAWNKE